MGWWSGARPGQDFEPRRAVNASGAVAVASCDLPDVPELWPIMKVL